MSGDVFDIIDTNARQARASNVAAGVQATPELAARAEDYARRTGLPIDTVQRNLGMVQQRAAAQDATDAADASPDVARWLAADPQNAAVSHDSLPALAGVASTLGRAWANIGQGVASGTASTVAGLGATGDAIDRLIHGGALSGGSSAALVQPFVGLARTAAANYASRVQNPNVVDQALRLAGNIIPALGAGEAAPFVFAAQGADQGAQAADQAGQANSTAGALSTLGDAVVQGGLGAIPVAHYAEGLIPELGHAATTALARFGIGTAASGAQGAAMSLGSNLVTRSTVNAGQPLGEGVTDTGAQMAILHALTRLPGAVGDVRAAVRSTGDPTALNDAADALHATPMPVRSPDRTQALVREATQGRSVFVDADAVNSFLQSAKPEDAQAFLDNTGVEPQLEAATAAGAKVVIPADAYVMSKPAVDALRDHVSLSQDGLSPAEAQAASQAAPDALQVTGAEVAAQAKQDAADMAPQQRVFDDVRSQLKGIGIRPPEADAIASISAARYATRADRLGSDAWSEYQRAATGGGITFGDTPTGEGTRGQIDLAGEGQSIIRAFSGRDKSTVPHELGHAFLEELRADASREDAPQQVKDDYAAVSQHLGIEGDAIPVEAHESFARGFERYLMEGKAPSEALRGVFIRFKDWLTRIYRNVAGLNAPIEPIRGVYDRLLATDQEIAHAQQAQAYEPLTQADSGMTAAEHAAYRDAIAEAKETAREKLLSKAMKELRRTRTQEWNSERERIRAAVAEEVAQRPGVRAWNLLLRGYGEGGPVRLRRADVEDAIGADLLPRLPRSKGAIYADEGLHPDEVAALTGHDTGEGMLHELLRLADIRRLAREEGDKRDLPDLLTESETDAHMLAKHGDMLDPARLEAEALDAIHDDAREKVLQIEHRALERAAGEKVGPYTTDALKAYAEGVVGKLKTREVNPRVYLRSERQAGREAQRLLLAGDKVGALGAKRKQLMSFHLFRAAEDAQHELGVMGRRFQRYARKDVNARIDQDFYNQISSLLARFGFREPSPNTIPPLDDGNDGGWLNEREKEGLSILMPRQFLSDYYRTPYSEMSVEEARDLDMAVKSLAHFGAQAKAFTVAGRREEMDKLAEEVNARVLSSKVQAKFDASANRAVHMIDSARATLLRAETMADMMDNGDPNGPFNRVYVQGASDANARENELLHGFHKEIAKAYESAPWSVRRTWQRRVETDLTDPASVGRPGKEPVPIKLTKADVIGMALNMGNADNFARLTEGFGWEPEAVRSLVNRTLKAGDWQWVQGIWNALDSLRKPYFDAEERLTGVRPVPVEATPVETPHGTFPGGYYPVVHDPSRSGRARDNQEKTLEAAFGRKMSGAATRNGSAQARTEFRAPLKLSPEAVIFGHLRDVTKRIAWAEWYLNTQRFLNDSRIKKAVETRLGPDFHNAMLKLSKLAVGYNLVDERSLAWAEKLLRASRVNAVNAISGINPRIMFEHAGAHPQSIAVLGKEWWAKGVADYASSPHLKAQFVFDRSPEMVARKDQANREIADLLSDLGEHKDLATTLARKAGLNPDVVAKVREYPHVPVSWINLRLVAMPTWLGGYHKALAAGMTEEQAIRAGDKAVRVSHSSGAAKDLSIAQSGNEFYRMFTTFFAYHLNQWNLYERSVEGVRQSRSAKDYGRSLESFLWALPAAALVGSLVSGHHPDDFDPKDWAEWALDRSVRSLWEGVPIARNVMNYGVDLLEREAKMKGAVEPDLFSGIPQASAVKATRLAGQDAFRLAAQHLGLPIDAKEPSPQWMRHLIAAPGYFLGLPSESPARSAEYVKELRQGTQQPRDGAAGALDTTEGVLFGPPPTKH